MTCQACDEPMAPRTRPNGNPKRFCSQACQKWAYLNPGKKRTRQRDCENCGQSFRPPQERSRFCSRFCAEVACGSRVYGPHGQVIVCHVCEERKAVPMDWGGKTKTCLACRPEWERIRGLRWRAENLDRVRECERRRESKRDRVEYNRARYEIRRAVRIASRLAAAATEVERVWLALPPASPPEPVRVFPCSALACERQRRFLAGFCLECGESFVACQDRGDRFCSLICGKRHGRRQRRGRQKAAFVEPVFRRKIFERDHWRCQICGKRVVKTAVVPHPNAPTIDHIVPLDFDGDHSMANAQTAHFICNSEKGAGARNDQLRLVG